MQSHARSQMALLAVLATEQRNGAGLSTAEILAIDDDPAAATGEADHGPREGSVGERREAQPQATAGRRGVAVENESEPVAAQVGEQLGQASGGFAQVNRTLEGRREQW